MIAALVFALATPSSGPPPGWVSRKGPNPELSGERICANHSRHQWLVEASAGELKVISIPPGSIVQDPLPFPISFEGVPPTPPPPPPPPSGVSRIPRSPVEYAETRSRRHVARIRGGWLIGFNAGESGGSLWWYAENGGTGTKLTDDNVVAILPVNEGSAAFVVAGLAHLGLDTGRVIRLRAREALPLVEELLDLGTEPQAAAAQPDGSVLVLTNTRLLGFQTGGGHFGLCTVNYDALYPRSMVVMPTGDIFIGMRHYVSRIRWTDDRMRCSVEWFVPKNCNRFVEQDFDCVCHP